MRSGRELGNIDIGKSWDRVAPEHRVNLSLCTTLNLGVRSEGLNEEESSEDARIYRTIEDSARDELDVPLGEIVLA